MRKPRHRSWRVLLLPLLGEQELFDAYDFDEPWDGPNNRRLIDKMPSVYGCRWDDGRLKGHTSYVVIVGPQTPFPGSRPRKISQITDGTSRTLMVVEMSGSEIPWTAPRDLNFDEMSFEIADTDAPSMRTIHDTKKLPISQSYVCVTLVDGSCHAFARDDVTPDGLRALITADGGQTISGW